MKKIVIILLASTLSGCSLYKQYSRPEVKTDNLFGNDIKTQDTTPLGNMSWKELFTDTDLQALIDTGLVNNIDLNIAKLRIDQSKASLQSARLAYIPSLSFSPQGTIGGVGESKSSQSYQLPLSASWEVDIFGKLTNAKREAKSALEQSEAYRQAVQSQLIAAIANSYYTLLMLDDQLEISQKTAEIWTQNVATMQALMNAGLSNQAAVAQAQATKCNVEASVLDLKRQINEVENAICTTLGQTPTRIARGKLSEQVLPQNVSIGVPIQMLSNRPDVKSAEAALAQAFYYTNQARAAFYPTITLGGSVGWSNSLGAAITNPGAFIWQVLGSLVQPIFNKGLNQARLKIAKSQQEEARLNFQQSLLNAGSEVNNALTQSQTANEKVLIYESQIGYLEDAVKNTQLMMRHGSTTYLEVLVAQQTLLQAQLSQTANRFDQIQGVVNLYSALGGGR